MQATRCTTSPLMIKQQGKLSRKRKDGGMQVLEESMCGKTVKVRLRMHQCKAKHMCSNRSDKTGKVQQTVPGSPMQDSK